ncbi:MAG: DUF1365 domain-containing protein [Opitutales bacterium]
MQHSQIFRGEVTHRRMGPVEHAFSYPVTFFCFDLDELPQIRSASPLFGYNEFRPLTLRDSDYLRGHDQPIPQQLEEFLKPAAAGERTCLVSSPRYLGYAFNPVNFYLRMRGDQLVAALAEVNNTFGDRHIYPLPELDQVQDCFWTARCPKDFHVSPFNDMEGDYHFSFRVEQNRLFLGVDLHRGGNCVMKTWIQGRGTPLTTTAITRHALLHPLDTAVNSMPRILWQAARLHYQKKMKVFHRPSPSSKHTLIDRDQKEDDHPVI